MKDLPAILSTSDNDTLRITSGFEGSKQSCTLQLTVTQHRLTVLSDHLPHQWLPHGLVGNHATHTMQIKYRQS